MTNDRDVALEELLALQEECRFKAQVIERTHLEERDALRRLHAFDMKRLGLGENTPSGVIRHRGKAYFVAIGGMGDFYRGGAKELRDLTAEGGS